MLFVDLLVRVPLPREERVLPTDDLAVEEGGERGVLLSQALDLEVAAEERAIQVNVLERKGIG